MILTVAGLTGSGIQPGMDLSGYVDRTQSFDIEAAVGKRIDTSHFFLMDTLPSSMQVPDRAEVWIYDLVSNFQKSYAAMILADLPSWYGRLNDLGSSVRDWTGGGKSGSFVGGVTKGVAGALNDGDKAMTFDGSTGYLTLPNGSFDSIFQGHDFSVEALVYWTSATGDQPVFGAGAGGVNDTGMHFITRAGSLYMGFYGDDLSTAVAPTLNTWHHVVFTYVAATKQRLIYLDGVQVGSGTAAAQPAIANNSTIYWATEFAANSRLNGSLDELAIYSYALSPVQVATHNAMVAACLSDPQVTDPTWAISAYNTWRNGAGSESTSGTAANWTPRLFGGYVATPKYTADGAQRYVEISCQDYTVRLRTTVTNMAFAAGISDQSIIQQLFARYRSDYNTANVNQIVASFPAITYPVHTLEQCLERIIKVTRGYYRADYYKQLWYGVAGQQLAPFNLSDIPDYNLPLWANSGFETLDPNDATLPYGWSRGNSVGSGTATIDNTTSHSGSRSVALTNPASVNYGAIFTKQGLAVGPGDVLNLSIWVKASVGGRSFGPLRVTFANPGATVNAAGQANAQPSGQAGVVIVDAVFNPTTSFALYTTSVTVPAGYAWAFIEIYAGGSPNIAWPTTFNIDDFSGARPLPTFPTENLDYTPDGSGLANRVWVIGSTYLSAQQAYQVPPALVNGTAFQFPLPGNPEATGMTITVAAVDQGKIGVSPGDGDVTTPSSFKYNTLIQHVPATVSFKVTPSAGQAVIITGKFRYPLVQVVTDSALVAATGGVVFEAIVRDKRINDAALAKSVGQAFLKLQGSTLKGGTCTIRTRQVGGVLVQPGHVINIKNDVLFRNILKDANGNLTTTAVVIVTQLRTLLDDDTLQPYAVQVSFADRNVSGGY